MLIAIILKFLDTLLVYFFYRSLIERCSTSFTTYSFLLLFLFWKNTYFLHNTCKNHALKNPKFELKI